MTARLVAGVLAVATLGMAGCGTKEGQRVVEFDREGKRIQEKKVGADGRYTLQLRDRPDITFYVVKGERVGFRKTGAGEVEAYAGDNPTIELEPEAARDAYWEFEQKARR